MCDLFDDKVSQRLKEMLLQIYRLNKDLSGEDEGVIYLVPCIDFNNDIDMNEIMEEDSHFEDSRDHDHTWETLEPTWDEINANNPFVHG
jgi:hypothetical protein